MLTWRRHCSDVTATATCRCAGARAALQLAYSFHFEDDSRTSPVLSAV
jgi:hypothetical protein